MESNSLSDGTGSLLVNAVIGAAAAFFLSFIPFSTFLGGVIAGYLQGGTGSDGVKSGALSGVILMAPVILIALVLLLFIPAANVGIVSGIGIGGGIAIVTLLLVAYVAIPSALGGLVGVYLNREL